MNCVLIPKKGFNAIFPSSAKHVLMLIMICLCSIKGFSQPANDDPCNAIALTVGTTCVSTVYTNAAATATTGVPAPGCANYLGGDVWFSVVVPAGGSLIFDTQEGVITDGGMAIYSAATCAGPFTLIECDDDDGVNAMSNITRNGLTPGSTIWIRVWEYGNNGNGTFGICVRTPPPPPANDDPCGAIALTASLTCNYATYSNESATATSGVPAPGCANYLGGDVWFSVVVPAGGALIFDTQTGVILDAGMAIYSGAACGGPLTLIECDDDDSPNGAMSMIVRSGLTPGSTIWIRVWEYGNNGNGTFGICVRIPPPPPANDDPCGAIPLTASNSCTYATYTNESATATSGVPAPGCASYLGGDVWFSVVVPCTGSLNIDTETGVMLDGGMALYTAPSCNGPFTLVRCDDDGSVNGAMPQILATNLVPGSTVYVRVWELGNNNNGTFGICVTIPQPAGPSASCSTAQGFCSSSPVTYNNGTNQPSLGANGIYGCLGSTPNPYWYFMQVQNSGSITITMNQTSTTGQPLDVDFALWGPFANLNSSCSGLSASNIISCSYSTAATEIVNLPNAIAGQYYILLITNFSNQPGIITFSQTGGTGSSSCDVVCTLSAANTGPVCPGGTINLTTTGITGGTYAWTGPNCFASTAQNPTGVVVPTVPGTYIYTVSATAPTASGSFSVCSDTTIVTVLPRPVLGLDKTLTICQGSTGNLTTQYTTTGFTAAWTFGGVAVGTPTSVNTPGVYQLIATNASGCKDTALVTLAIDVVSATATSSGATCVTNGVITVTNPTGISPYTYSISTSPGVFQASNVFNPPAGGPYTITTKDAIGCTSTQAVVVDSTNELSVTVLPAQTVCRGQSVVLTTVGNATSYVWTPAAGLDNPAIQNPTASPDQTTNYMVTATLGTCDTTASVNVVVDKSLSIDLGPNISVVSGGEVQLLATITGAYNSILWTPAAGLSSTTIINPVLKPVINIGTATYTATVTNALGCFATDQIDVTIIPYCIKVKNAFTPNGDGINELWTVYEQFDCLKKVSLAVFNRYGNTVFESSNYTNNWDGTYKGKPVPDGTYYAVIQFTLIGGKPITIKTDLTIIR